MKTIHDVFLVPGIIPLIYVFLLGWTDVDVFHVNWTFLTSHQYGSLRCLKNCSIPLLHHHIDSNTSLSHYCHPDKHAQPIACLHWYFLVYELIMKAETVCIILENHCMLTWLVAQEELLFKTLLTPWSKVLGML